MLYINNKQMPIKRIRIRLKEGDTASDFAEYFGVSIQEFLEKLEERLTTCSFGDYAKMLDANERKRKKMSKKTEKESDEPTMNEVIEVVEEVETLEAMQETYEERRVKELEQIIVFCNGRIASYESQMADNEKEKNEIIQQIEAVKQSIAGYAEKIRQANKQLIELQSQKQQNSKMASEIQLSIEESKAELEKAQIEFESYQRVKISFGESGIQISKEGIEPSAEEVEDKFLELSDTDPYADYSARNLRKAAEVLCSIDNIELMGLEYEVDYGKFEVVKEIVEGVRAA